ncbi:MAG: radical SAM family heme chaperone HemW, partial [Alphaproteobacteria bacterium]
MRGSFIAPPKSAAADNHALALYVHWPFCEHKCPYCDFNSHVRPEVDQAAWREALLAELSHYASALGPRILTSIFFGGGTPSLMAPETVADVIEAAGRHFGPVPDLEVTLEANPGSVEAGRFRAYRGAGVNRLSLWVQSLDDPALAFLGRIHSADEAIAALCLARDTFARFSFDLIYGRPGQTLAAWRAELARALAFGPEHLSLYQLTIEDGTPFSARHRAGEFGLPDDETAACLFEETRRVLDQAGLPAYEVSNHAAPGQESRHNLAYWRYGDYVGIGPGAHGRFRRRPEDPASRIATAGWRRPETWLARVRDFGHGAETTQPIAPAEAFEECLMMGLRLTEGLRWARLEAATGRAVPAPAREAMER